MTSPMKKPYDCVQEYLAFTRHGKLKEEKQHPATFNACCREQEHEKAVEGMIHGCVKALYKSRVNLEQAKGCVGNSIKVLQRKQCPISRSCYQNTSKKQTFLMDVTSVNDTLCIFVTDAVRRKVGRAWLA